ncbi:MAG: hypothetical protein IJX02_04175 [Clostridia bacterium]|nr:hypothetical protein [Clostridia bacterium]
MIKSKKRIIYISLVAIVGVVLIFLGSINLEGDNNEEKLDVSSYTKELENKIEAFLLTVDGINKANVIITLDSSNEKVYAQNQSTYDFLTINTDGSESPVYITEIYPTIRGIAISCTNGESDQVKMKITKLISAYLGISANRIEIVGIK